MLSRDTVVAGRYELIECLGAGAMGEVWRARDTRFESRLVAVKFLREDETLKEDAVNRDRLVIRLEHQAARGGITTRSAVDLLAGTLAASNIEGLKAKVAETFGAAETVAPPAIVALFDGLVNDPGFNDNARMRAKMRRLFRDEANTVANLRHDNIVSIFDYGDHDGLPYLVMDYIEGRTLYQVLQAQEKLERLRRLQLMEDLCSGLGYAHRHKLVHRDIKPANLIIDGSTGSLKILDFGVVRRLGSKSTLGMPVGTFCYMSPEQTRGASTLDHRSDIFAVGVVFYELLSGRKAFPPGKNINELVARIQREPPAPLSDPTIPEAIEVIINKAIEKQPEARYQDLTVMARDITRIRARLEADEQSERTVLIGAAKLPPPRVPAPAQAPVPPPAPKSSSVGLADLLESAEHSFVSGADEEVIATCRKIVAVKPDFQPALSLLARAEARRADSRLGDALQQAESLMAQADLTSAEAMLDRAREVNRSSSRIRVLQAKLDEARAAEKARVEQQRLEAVKPPVAVAPIAAAKAIDLDADAVTVPIRRDPPRKPLSQPMAPQPPLPPPVKVQPAPSPVAPAARAADEQGQTMLIRPIAAPPRFQARAGQAPGVPPAPASGSVSREAAKMPSKPSPVPVPPSVPKSAAPLTDLPLQAAPAGSRAVPPPADKPTVAIPSPKGAPRPPAPRQDGRTARPFNTRLLWAAAIVTAILAAAIYFAPRFISWMA